MIPVFCHRQGDILAHNYIKRAVGTAIGITLGALSYFSGTANAQEAAPKPEDLLKRQQEIHAKAYETYKKGKSESDLQKKLEYFQQAKKLYQQAEDAQAGDQFPRAISFFDEKIPEVERQIKKAQPGTSSSPGNQKDFSSGGDTGQKISLVDFLFGQKKYASLLEIRGGPITEDKEGDFQSVSANLGTYAEAHLAREYLSWVNAAGNNQNRNRVSAMLDICPMILFEMDQDNEWARELFRFGVAIENSKEKEWEYLEDITEDSDFRIEYTENIKNIQEDEFYSFWAEFRPKLFLLRTSFFYDHINMTTESDALTVTENKNDPDGDYSEARQSTVEDDEWYRGGTFAAGLTVDNGIKGQISLITQFMQEYIRLAGQRRTKNDIYHFGLSGELYTNDDTFGAALSALEEISEDPVKGKKSMRQSSGQAVVAINISPIDLEDNVSLEAMIFADMWGQVYNKNTAEGEQYGGGIGMMIGSKVGNLPQIVKLLSERNMHRIGARPEISDETQDFLTSRGLRNLPLSAIRNDDNWGFAVFVYGGAEKVTGLDSKQKTIPFVDLAAILDTPPIAFVLAGHYKEGILARDIGVDLAAHIKKHGFSVGAGFSQSTNLSTDELQRMVDFYLLIPFGGSGKDKK